LEEVMELDHFDQLNNENDISNDPIKNINNFVKTLKKTNTSVG